MLSNNLLAKDIFEATLAAIEGEDKILQAHCDKPCGYHHGISSLTEPMLMHLIFRSLIGSEYQVRLEQAYPSDPRCQADLVLLRNDRWVACIEAKWLDSNAKAGLAKRDIERMQQNFGAEITKLLLGFWIKDPRQVGSVDRWLNELSQASGTDNCMSDSFITLWWSPGVGRHVKVEAGVTLFEVA